MTEPQPYIAAAKRLPEFTLKAIVLSIFLAAILSASNAYLGLKVGLIVSASIPAIMVSMVILRLFRNHNILEHNIVQTGASASASIASGIVFVLPALLIIQYWTDFNYWQTVFICITGGLLGILLSIPLRRTLLNQSELSFPEGTAIAEVLKANESQAEVKDLVWGGLAGAAIQFSQTGFKIMAESVQAWFKVGQQAVGFTMGFDATLLGVGYLIGFEVGLSIFLGALFAWVIGIPVLTTLQPLPVGISDVGAYVMGLWNSYLRYVGIGTLLVGGIWSLIVCAKPIYHSVVVSFKASLQKQQIEMQVSRINQDIPLRYIAWGLVALGIIIAVFFFNNFNFMQTELSDASRFTLYGISIAYIFIAGFVFSAICAYFSGLVGMSASPTSGVNIAALICITLLLSVFISVEQESKNSALLLNAAGFTIIITTIIACAGTMANGNIQDLKTGQILGATPWKLQVMLIIGTIVATLVAPPVIDVLYSVYGIGGAMPRAGMDPADMLPAPQAALIATVSHGILLKQLPLHTILIGIVIAFIVIGVNRSIKSTGKQISLISFAIGIYLPMTVTMPLFLGSLIAFLVSRHYKKHFANPNAEQMQTIQKRQHNSILIACGLVAGGSIMGILLAIPFALKGSPDALSLVSDNFQPIAILLSSIVTLLICMWMYKRATLVKKTITHE